MPPQDWQTTLAHVQSHLKTLLAQEATDRDQADQAIRKRLTQLMADIKAAFQDINEALDRLEAPPTREESPVLTRIQEALDDLTDRVQALESRQRQLVARLK